MWGAVTIDVDSFGSTHHVIGTPHALTGQIWHLLGGTDGHGADWACTRGGEDGVSRIRAGTMSARGIAGILGALSIGSRSGVRRLLGR